MKLQFIRGDSFEFGIPIQYDDGTVVKESDIDTLIFTCRKTNDKASPILIEKTKDKFKFEDNVYWLTIEPTDTEMLDYGTYNFDVEVTLTDGYRKTFKSSFELTYECTMHGDDNG